MNMALITYRDRDRKYRFYGEWSTCFGDEGLHTIPTSKHLAISLQTTHQDPIVRDNSGVP